MAGGEADGEDDKDEKGDDDEEGGGDLVCSKKDGGPEEVEDELEGEGGEVALEAGARIWSVPDEGETDADEDVESAPDGSEDPIGWGAGRAGEGGIPRGD